MNENSKFLEDKAAPKIWRSIQVETPETTQWKAKAAVYASLKDVQDSVEARLDVLHGLTRMTTPQDSGKDVHRLAKREIDAIAR